MSNENRTSRMMREEARNILHRIHDSLDGVISWRKGLTQAELDVLTNAVNNTEMAIVFLTAAEMKDEANKLTGRDQSLIVAGIRSLQHFGPAPGSEDTPDTGGTDGLCEEINLARSVILETGGTEGKQEEGGTEENALTFTPAEYSKEDMEEHFDVKLTDEQFRDFANFTKGNAGTLDLIDQDVFEAFKYWRETREREERREPDAIRREYPDDDFIQCPNCGGMNEKGRQCDCKEEKGKPAEKPKPYPSFEDAAFALYELMGEIRSEQGIYKNRIDEPTELEARIDRAIERFELFQEG